MKRLSTLVIVLLCLCACTRQQVWPSQPVLQVQQETDRRFQLSSFTAERRGTDFQLTFTTIWEKDIVELEVLRGTTLKQFCTINSIVPKGNSSAPQVYQLLDTVNAGASVYYMLKYKTADGTWGYSAPIKSGE
ncbi:hypothetical protein EXU57_22405 [Segetibacter sp. 3557_3]|uniref:hypothetical protein n=1 Tax=Segetibacter sp. 3557_3 TaxID=2547429 RepID=UPI0010589E47|nr:hypothetical protein [Segetibacter sp. 3557_3]TDH19813.1 hypothetical protein EXU57_22405 [Segetibacter sp. 3557_3]